jgi:uncharacterized protein (TIGR02145 family)
MVTTQRAIIMDINEHCEDLAKDLTDKERELLLVFRSLSPNLQEHNLSYISKCCATLDEIHLKRQIINYYHKKYTTEKIANKLGISAEKVNEILVKRDMYEKEDTGAKVKYLFCKEKQSIEDIADEMLLPKNEVLKILGIPSKNLAIKIADGGLYVDERDGQAYQTVKIGNQIWMTENLRYTIDGSSCYNNDESLCKLYGRLYRWDDARKAIPEGWHLPSYTDWECLVNYAGGGKIAGKKLKSVNGWNSFEGKDGNGIDTYSFAAMPGGYKEIHRSFREIRDIGIWWSATGIHVTSKSFGQSHATHAVSWRIDCNNDGIYHTRSHKNNGFSVRCVAN